MKSLLLYPIDSQTSMHIFDILHMVGRERKANELARKNRRFFARVSRSYLTSGRI